MTNIPSYFDRLSLLGRDPTYIVLEDNPVAQTPYPPRVQNPRLIQNCLLKRQRQLKFSVRKAVNVVHPGEKAP